MLNELVVVITFHFQFARACIPAAKSINLSFEIQGHEKIQTRILINKI